MIADGLSRWNLSSTPVQPAIISSSVRPAIVTDRGDSSGLSKSHTEAKSPINLPSNSHSACVDVGVGVRVGVGVGTEVDVGIEVDVEVVVGVGVQEAIAVGV